MDPATAHTPNHAGHARNLRIAARASGSCLVEGEACSGKTELLIERAAHWLCERGIQPKALTILVQAEQRHFFAKRLRARVGDLASRVAVETAPQLGEKILRELHTRLHLKKTFTVATRQEQMNVLAQSCGLDPDAAKLWAARIGEHKRGDPADETLRRHRLCYDSALRLHGQVDTDDLLLLPTLLITCDDLLQTRLHARHRFVLVDDAHRLDALEHKLLALLLAPDAECWTTWHSSQTAAEPAWETSWLPKTCIELRVNRGQMSFNFNEAPRDSAPRLSSLDEPAPALPATPAAQQQILFT